jgi:DNA-binding NarL/FixJ family response regulator
LQGYDYIYVMKKPGIIIVDDHKLFRSGLKYIIEESNLYQVLAEASNGAEFLDLLKDIAPDLVILDINMPVMNGIEAAKKAIAMYPGLPILILSMHSESEYYTTLLETGVKGFVLKDADNEEFFTAIQKVLRGGTYFSQQLLLNIIRKESQINTVKLTRREKEVLELLSKGHSNQEISVFLHISQRTVERHRTILLEKTGSRNSVSLIVYAIKNKLV